MAITPKSFSAPQVTRRTEIHPGTATIFKHKVRKAMKSSGTIPMEDEVESERLGKSYVEKKKKVVCTVELTNDNKVKRFYTKMVTDFSE
jgi:hypothetical protein